MTVNIDMDALEAECNGGPIRGILPIIAIRSDTLLALVRAVRAAQALWPLTPRESWVGTRHLYVDIRYPAEQAPFAEFNAALAPFRKEVPK